MPPETQVSYAHPGTEGSAGRGCLLQWERKVGHALCSVTGRILTCFAEDPAFSACKPSVCDSAFVLTTDIPLPPGCLRDDKHDHLPHLSKSHFKRSWRNYDKIFTVVNSKWQEKLNIETHFSDFRNLVERPRKAEPFSTLWPLAHLISEWTWTQSLQRPCSLDMCLQ